MAIVKPTHRLKILNKKTNEKVNDAGAGWQNKDGSISLVLSSFIDFDKVDGDCILTLFPIDKVDKL